MASPPAAGQSTVAVPVRLGRESGSPVTLTYATADRTARAGVDYTATTGTLTFPAGQTSTTVRVPIRAPGTRIEDSSGSVRITRTTGPVSVALDDVDAAAGTTVSVPVRLSSAPATGESVQVTVTTADGTARAGPDYTAITSAVLSIPGGSTTATVRIPTTAGAAGTTLVVRLSGVVGPAVLANGTATVALTRPT